MAPPADPVVETVEETVDVVEDPMVGTSLEELKKLELRPKDIVLFNN